MRSQSRETPIYRDDSEKLSQILRTLRRTHREELPDWREPVGVLVKNVYLKGRPVDALILTLTPSGCEWAKFSGGCTMCGEFSGSMGGSTIPGEYHLAQFSSALAKYFAPTKFPWIRIFNEGSFLNAAELDLHAQATIISIASLVRGVERITVESRAEYVTISSVLALREALAGPVELEVGIGVEAQSDIVRNVCIRKGQSRESLQKAVSILRDSGIRSLAYVLVKPPFLTEGEALEEAVKTVQFSFDIGFDAVKLEPVSVHDWSFVDALFSQGLYQLPWLWTVMEVVQQSRDLGEIRIGGVEYYPTPKTLAQNHHCDSDCTERGWSAIRVYNQTHDPTVFDVLDCECRTSWAEEIQKKAAVPLEERIREAINDFDLKSYVKAKTERDALD